MNNHNFPNTCMPVCFSISHMSTGISQSTQQSSLVSLKQVFLPLRWFRTLLVWCTSRWQGPRTPWWEPWWAAWRWPGRPSAELSSVPWAPRLARWSAVGWSWPWASLRNGLTRTCRSPRENWVSSDWKMRGWARGEGGVLAHPYLYCWGGERCDMIGGSNQDIFLGIYSTVVYTWLVW